MIETLILLGLAAHRLWALWMLPAPASTPLTRLRDWLAGRHRLIKQGATCGMCMSIWVPVMIGAMWYVLPPMIWLLALSDVIGLIEMTFVRINRPPTHPMVYQPAPTPQTVNGG